MTKLVDETRHVSDPGLDASVQPPLHIHTTYRMCASLTSHACVHSHLMSQVRRRVRARKRLRCECSAVWYRSEEFGDEFRVGLTEGGANLGASRPNSQLGLRIRAIIAQSGLEFSAPRSPTLIRRDAGAHHLLMTPPASVGNRDDGVYRLLVLGLISPHGCTAHPSPHSP